MIRPVYIRPGSPKNFVKIGDVKECGATRIIFDASTYEQEPGEKSYRLYFKNPAGVGYWRDMQLDGTDAIYDVRESDTVVHGLGELQIEVRGADGTRMLFRKWEMYIDGSIPEEMDRMLGPLAPLVEELEELRDPAVKVLESESERVKAENTRAEAETARKDAETARVAAEKQRASAETTRASSETARAEAETKRAQAENTRAEAESSRANAETARVAAEKQRASAETTRASSETARAEAETKRAQAENTRAEAESSRANAETARVAAEKQRASAETTRADAETKRVQAEQTRKEEMNRMKDDIQNYIDAAPAYGVRWDGSSSPALTRLGAAIGATAAAKVGASQVVQNTFDGLSPWNSMIRCNVDNAGNVIFEGEPNFSNTGSVAPYAYKLPVMVRIKKFFYKALWGLNADGETYWREWWISPSKLPGYKTHEAFVENGVETDEIFVGAYAASAETVDGKTCLTSLSGEWPLAGIGRQTFRTNARNRGAGWNEISFFDWSALQLLYIVEYADFNAQNTIGAGISSKRANAADVATVAETGANRIIVSSAAAAARYVGEAVSVGVALWSYDANKRRIITAIEDYDDANKAIVFDGDPLDIAIGDCIWCTCRPSGDTDDMGSYTGRTTQSDANNRCQVSYRGIEGFYSNGFAVLDGCTIYDYEWFTCDNPAKWSDADPRTADGYVSIGTCPSADGYFKVPLKSETFRGALIPEMVGSGERTYFCDYYWRNPGLRSPRVGGSPNTGDSDGPFSWHAIHAPTTGYWSFVGRLRYRRP